MGAGELDLWMQRQYLQIVTVFTAKGKSATVQSDKLNWTTAI